MRYDNDWPDWLRAIWGSSLDGRFARNAAAEAHKDRLAKAEAWRNSPEGRNARYRQARVRGQVVPRYVPEALERLKAEMGMTATEQPPPSEQPQEPMP